MPSSGACRFLVDFPLPDAAAREVIWRRRSRSVPRWADIDFGFLGVGSS